MSKLHEVIEQLERDLTSDIIVVIYKTSNDIVSQYVHEDGRSWVNLSSNLISPSIALNLYDGYDEDGGGDIYHKIIIPLKDVLMIRVDVARCDGLNGCWRDHPCAICYWVRDGDELRRVAN